jgi:hypothetical protein
MLLAPPKTPGSSLRVQLLPLFRRESIHEIRLRALQPLLSGRYLHSPNLARIAFLEEETCRPSGSHRKKRSGHSENSIRKELASGSRADERQPS